MSLEGKRQYQARLKAIRQSFKPIGRLWGDATVRAMKPKVPVRTGKLRRSIRVKNNTQRKTVVAGWFTGYFIDAGTKAHDIKPKQGKAIKFAARGAGTIYARKAHQRGLRARPFRQRSAEAGMRETPMAKVVIDQYNKAA